MRSLAVVAAAAAAASASAQNAPYTLQLVPNENGAVCLDGSAPGFYWYPGSGADADKFIIYHEGGGWCYEEADCLGRSMGNLGSSKHWTPNSTASGLMSNDCATNPYLCNWNKVYMKYCDGFSFSGNRDAPLMVNGTALYMRGARILETLVAAVNANQMTPAPSVPLSKASRVLVTGCSAGGLATYMHADTVKTLLAGLYTNPTQDYRVASISGGFQYYPAMVSGQPIYGQEIQYAFAMQNVSGGHTNTDCLAYYTPRGEAWKCGMAPFIYPFIKAPFFALNSLYDSWQTGCVLTPEPVFNTNSFANGNCSAAPGWETCAKDPAACTTDQISQGYVPFGASQLDMFTSTAKYSSPGNGVFLTSCHTHCEAQSDGPWTGFTIGGVTMREAVQQWMSQPTTAAPVNVVDCTYTTTPGNPYCNPTCSAALGEAADAATA